MHQFPRIAFDETESRLVVTANSDQLKGMPSQVDASSIRILEGCTNYYVIRKSSMPSH